jgi:hypothetical protein
MLSPKRGTGRKTPKSDKNPIAAFFALGFLIESIASGSALGVALRSAGLEPATLVTKLKLAWAIFGGQRFGLVLR